MLGAELVEHAHDHAAQLVAAVLVGRGGDRVDQQLEPALLVAGVERGERVGELRVVLEPDPRGEALGGVGAGRVGEHRERVVALAPLVQQARERDGGVRAAGLELERAPQRVLVALLHQRVRLGGQQRRRGTCAPAAAAGRR